MPLLRQNIALDYRDTYVHTRGLIGTSFNLFNFRHLQLIRHILLNRKKNLMHFLMNGIYLIFPPRSFLSVAGARDFE